MSEMPETKATPYDTGNEEKARMEADGWEEWFMLHKRGYPSSMLWVRWPKPPAPTLSEAMKELRETWRTCGEWNWGDLRRVAAKVLAAYDAQAEDPTRDALVKAAVQWALDGAVCIKANEDLLLVAVYAYRKAHPAPADD